MAWFALFAIIVSCLGAYGLIMFSARQREKEIGVRKVLGASILNLVSLLFKEFIWLFVVGFALAIPVTYYFTEDWLNNFSYRIEANVGIFIIGGALTLSIVWLTISYRSFKAALINPANSLRDE